MNKRFWIIGLVIILSLLTLSALGLSSLKMHRKGLEAERQQEFIDVARQISFDVKQKVDTFLQTEQNRPYTEYQPYYVPENVSRSQQQAVAVVQSPLADAFSNEFANGYFQLEPDGRLTSPYLQNTRIEGAAGYGPHTRYYENVRHHLLPSLQNGRTLAVHRVEPAEREKKEDEYASKSISSRLRRDLGRANDKLNTSWEKAEQTSAVSEKDRDQVLKKPETPAPSTSKGASSRRGVYRISNLDQEQQKVQFKNQSRAAYEMNVAGNEAVQTQESASQAVQTFVDNTARQRSTPSSRQQEQMMMAESKPAENQRSNKEPDKKQRIQQQQRDSSTMMPGMPMDGAVGQSTQAEREDIDQDASQTDTVLVRIEPFVPVTVPDPTGGNGIFAGQVFLLRHVQIENRHIVQGFQLNEDELLSQVTQSARKFLLRGMDYELSKTERPNAAFTAILQFDFGEIVLNLLEADPGFIQTRVTYIRNWFFGILAVVWLAVLIAMAALWKNLHEQVQLSRKKDDFISAVSHELRTPLTSIRMYTEMLEKDWVKTDTKRREYYTTMRTESERLSRLIENVLDFSRIQRGKKRYDFTIGDVNDCISEVVEMMRPCAERAGFVLEQRFEVLEPFAFDRDAVTQIVINLLDNALKYAKGTQDKHIIIRTRKQKHYMVIEVEDHGPGIARSQQKKIFDAFHRCEDESTRQSTGTGLGLALVKRFAEAHNGFVEIAGAKPTGACFRVGLTNTSAK